MIKLFGKRISVTQKNRVVRDIHLTNASEIISKLEEPGLLSEERKALCDDLRTYIANRKEVERTNMDYQVKRGTAIGCVGGIALSALSVAGALAVKAIRLTLR